MTKTPFSTGFSKLNSSHQVIFFSAQVKLGSYAWCSILGARKVIATGARWRIGNGQSVKVFHNCWLPGEGSGRIISPASSLHVDTVVADLLDDST